ncbi:UDP-glycosyltransferase 83A1-like [Euphorbia lathyris]|uniref:UDP-glycosyltransferase 83A1-like n=1 Tax=Euphorbia lathyris TaxID=212925 RepID=UPI00331437CC
MEYVPNDHHHQGTAHVVLVPFPLQGHVTPFMKLGHKLASHGVRVTFFITEMLHKRMEMAAMKKLDGDEQGHFRIVSVPDGLPPEDDRKDDTRLTKSIFNVMPGYLEDLIKRTNDQENGGKITCVIADAIFGWALEVAEKMGIKNAVFFTSAPGALAMILRIPQLIESGIIDANDGSMRKNEKIQLSPSLPAFSDADLLWYYPGSEQMKRSTFYYLCLVNQNLKIPNWVLGNWFNELDPSADDLLPNLLSIGPLLANEQQSTGNFWSEDLSCLSWLDRQDLGSVVYVAFGSSLKFSQQQFDELALGLELVGQPFLWVVHPDLIDGVATGYPSGLKGRVANLGKIVEWAPQEKVLAHPSIACYLTQCGWNSTLESISMGVPLLCWPYYTDQFYNRTCICYGWKVGLELCPDHNGIVTSLELKKKIHELLSDNDIRANGLKLKELAWNSIRNEGSSSTNFKQFVGQLKV